MIRYPSVSSTKPDELIITVNCLNLLMLLPVKLSVDITGHMGVVYLIASLLVLIKVWVFLYLSGPGTVLCDYTSYLFMFLSIATSNLVATSLARQVC